jgi:hypothetical protein
VFDLEDSGAESSFQTVIYTPKPAWMQSTPATKGRPIRTPSRRNTKKKSTAMSGLYPDISMYPDLSTVYPDVPTTSAEEFANAADGILQEMNARVQGNPFHI